MYVVRAIASVGLEVTCSCHLKSNFFQYNAVVTAVP